MKKFFLILAILLMHLFSIAQTEQGVEKVQELTIPLSKPDEPGKLKISLISGSIKVTGYNGKEVLIKVFSKTYQSKSEEKDGDEEQGLFKVSNNTFAMTVYEEGNFVKINSESRRQTLNFEIMVPEKFDLDLNTVNGGDVNVSNVEGEIEVGNVNGGISMNDVSGSIVANTVNGPVIVSMKEVTPDVPMAFTSLNGKVDVTFPKNTKLTTKIKSEWGEVYSDFKLEIKQREPQVEKKSGKNFTKYVVDKWIYADVNGGGPEFMFKNMHGNIYLRMK